MSEEAPKDIEQTPPAPEVIDSRDIKIKELEAKVLDYDIRFLEARGFVKKLETEVEQIRLRSERDAQKQVDQKLSDFALKLIPALDLFELSLKSTENGVKDFDSFVNGIRLIESEMKSAFEKLGFERIQKAGENFDPHRHEAIAMLPVGEKERDGSVLEVLKVGYALSGRIIRPAQVTVGQLQEPEA